MYDALGFIELPNLADAVVTLDIMLKTSGVKFVTWEKTFGGRLVTIIIEGDLSAVKEAIESAKQKTPGKIVAAVALGNPHQETQKMVALSAKGLKS